MVRRNFGRFQIEFRERSNEKLDKGDVKRMFSRFGIRSNMIRLIKSNFNLYRIILIGLIILGEISSYRWNRDFTKSDEVNIVIKNILILFLIPLILSIILMFVMYLKDKIEKGKISNEYYREIIKKVTPVELSYIDDYDIELKKDVVATLLQLQLKRKIEFVNRQD